MSRLFKNMSKDNKIYGNCQVLSPDGILMFRCDEKKANWYLKRDLADIVSRKPLTVKLNFKPNGLGNHNREFGLSEMPNICVVCGTKDFLNKHHVVPYCYRRYLPTNIKSHNHHDVLSTCIDCHERYERMADELKKELSIKYNSPLNGEVEDTKDIVRYCKISSTILNDNNIPKWRIKELKDQVKSFFGIKRLTKARLLKMTEEVKKNTVLKKTHGQIVIEKIDNIQEFVEMWRRHFIDNMNPKYLPSDWSINNKVKR